MNFMDEQAIKVLARLTEVGNYFPADAWIYHDIGTCGSWYKIKGKKYRREPWNLSELEANQKGIFRESEKK